MRHLSCRWGERARGRQPVPDKAMHALNNHLQSEEVCQALEAQHPPVDVVAEEEELPRREVHAQLPDVVREEIQVLFRFEERTYTGG